MVQSCLNEFEISVVKKFEQLRQQAMDSLGTLIQATLVNEFILFKSINFLADESFFEKYDDGPNSFSNAFQTKIKRSFIQWRNEFSEENFEIFLLSFSKGLAKQLEKLILSKQYYQLGAIILEKVSLRL